MHEVKKLLRLMFKEYRNQFSETQWNQIGVEIQNHAIDLIHNLNINSIGCYIQSQKSREVSTEIMLKSMLEGGISTCIPVVGEDFTMEMYRIRVDTTFETNKWGIPEPIGLGADCIVEPEGIVVPMLGADSNGYRIGYGKGFYDRYLSKKDVIKIGLCPQACIIEKLPTDEFDIPMDYLITENGIIRKNAK